MGSNLVFKEKFLNEKKRFYTIPNKQINPGETVECICCSCYRSFLLFDFDFRCVSGTSIIINGNKNRRPAKIQIEWQTEQEIKK